MLCGAIKFAFLIFSVALAGAEVVYKWNKTRLLPQMGLNNWRATSFAIAEDKMFLTLLDVEKQDLGNGVMGAFNMSASMSPDVSIFPFQNFYKINDPIRGKIATPISVRTDDCNRLWLLDSAVQNISGKQIKTNPGIYVFNVNTSQLIRSFKIPTTQWTSNSFFVNFAIDTENTEHDCEESYGYFADFNRFHILTYDFLRNKSELKSHPFFSPDPLVYTPNNFLFNHGHQDLNGIFGLAIAKHHPVDVMTTLYFHPLAATREFKVNTRAIKSEGNINYQDVEICKDKGENAESGASVFDKKTNSIFFAEVNTKEIGVLRLKDSTDPCLTNYFRYDMKLKSGYIVDLNILRSELWVLVDDKFDVTIHKLSIADINAEFNRSEHHQTTPATPSATSQITFHLTMLLIPLYISLWES